MPIRITGLNSGLDTESIISALVSSYNYKTQKYQKAQTKLSWKQDAWKSLNTKIYSLYTSVGNLRFSSAYNVKSVTASDSTRVNATATSNAVNGSYSVQVTSLAKTGYLTGGQLASGTAGTTKLSDLNVDEENKYSGTGTISLKTGDKTTNISVTEDMTVQEVINQFKEAGVNANYDESNRRIFISAKKTGADNDFALMGYDENGTNALTALGINVVSEAAKKEYAALANEYINAYGSLSEDEITRMEENMRAGKGAAESENENLKKIKSYYEDAIAYAKAKEKINDIDNDLLKELAFTEDLEEKYVDDAGNIYSKDDAGNYEIDITDTTKYTLASEKYEELKKEEFSNDENALKDFETNVATVKAITEKADQASEITVTLTMRETNGNLTADTENLEVDFADMLKKIDESIKDGATGVAETFEESSKETLQKVEAEMNVNNDTLSEYSQYVAKKYAYEHVEFNADGTSSIVNLSKSEGATRIEGSDAIIYVNGARYTDTTNTFAINGMTFTALGLTSTEEQMQKALANDTEGDEDIGAVTVTVNTDVQGIYDKIKDFLSQYNALINEMSSLYNAESAKGYEPLTDEEKDALSDTEVEKYEKKIKDSLLRRDDTLSGIISSMTNAMAKGVGIDTDGDGKIDEKNEMYYLSSFGIKTLGYFNAAKNEQNAFHIDGDEDDVNTSGNADKLMAAIAEDPDKVIQLMQGVASNLYNAVDAKMKSTSLKTVYTVYNDKEMASEYSDYTSLITKWQERLQDQEDYYYSKFAAMESALSKLNSQTSTLSGLFG